MKLRKIMAGVVATALAASTLAVAASAACLTKVEGTESTLSTGTGMWLLQLYNKGNEAEGKPETKLDIDVYKRQPLHRSAARFPRQAVKEPCRAPQSTPQSRHAP